MFYAKLFGRGGRTKKSSRKGKTVLSVPYQTSPKAKSKKADKRHSALRPGARISKRGKKYTETRANRSDISPKTGL